MAAIQPVITAAAGDRVGAAAAGDGVGAVVAIDAQIGSDQGGFGEIQQIGTPVPQQPHNSGCSCGIDLFDAVGGAEAAQADVHIAGAHGKNAVHTGAAAVGIGVEVREDPPAAGGGATHEIGVSTIAAIQPVIIAAAGDRIGAAATNHGVVSVITIEAKVGAQHGAGTEIQDVVVSRVEQAHDACGASGVDLFNAVLGSEARHTNVHIACSDGDDSIAATTAAIPVAVEA